MRTTTRAALIALVSAFTLFGCDSSTAPAEDPAPAPPTLPPPNPDGVLLPGEASAPARDALSPLPPSSVEETDIVDGLLTTRLIGSIAPGVTVADVNAALDSQAARIVTMDAGHPFVTIKIPAVAGEPEARAIADALVASGAFSYAAPAHVVTAALNSSTLRGGGEGDPGVDPAAIAHLRSQRFLAAWNARNLALENDDEIVVLVPDLYTSTLGHDEIDAQTFVGFGGPTPLPGPVIYPGNNGFVVSGIIGANVDDTDPTGTNPYPDDLLDLQSLALGGLTWTDVFWNIGYRLATSGNRFVLNTGLGYNDPGYTTHSKFDRAMHVVSWRITAALHYAKYLHVTSAGSDGGDPELNSPFVAAALFDDVREVVDLEVLSTADSVAIEQTWEDLLNVFPLATATANNVLIVGSDDEQPSTTMIRAIGSSVAGPCKSDDPGGAPLCNDGIAYYGGTAIAAAQVSGLAAYMMNLSEASPSEIRQILLQTSQQSTTGRIDAFDAILHLDDDEAGDVRRTLMDVAGFESNESDGDFDEYDLAPLLGYAAGPAPPDRVPEDVFSPIMRYDLNGDGLLGGLTSTNRFDLNGDGVYGTVTQSTNVGAQAFDENAVTDLDVLCFFAYSDLYNGDEEERDELLVAAHAGIFVEILGLPERIEAGVPVPITIRAGILVDGAPQPVEGIEIDLDVDDGEAAEDSGLTDASGLFTTNVTLDEDENVLIVEAEADFGDADAVATASSLRENEVEIISRYIWAGAEVFSTYQTEPGVPSQQIVSNFEWDDIYQVDTFETFDEEYSAADAGSAGGMQVSGNAASSLVSNLDLGSGTTFFGSTITASSNGTVTLTNPNPNFSNYQASAEGWVEVCVEFIVWGEPAAFALSGNVNSQYYDVELDDTFECQDTSNPCATISTGGELPPGEYDLDVCIFNGGFIAEGGQEVPTQGTSSESGNVNVTFSVNHNGVRLPAPTEPSSVSPRKPLSPETIARIEATREQRRALREQRRAERKGR